MTDKELWHYIKSLKLERFTTNALFNGLIYRPHTREELEEWTIEDWRRLPNIGKARAIEITDRVKWRIGK